MCCRVEWRRYYCLFVLDFSFTKLTEYEGESYYVTSTRYNKCKPSFFIVYKKLFSTNQRNWLYFTTFEWPVIMIRFVWVNFLYVDQLVFAVSIRLNSGIYFLTCVSSCYRLKEFLEQTFFKMLSFFSLLVSLNILFLECADKNSFCSIYARYGFCKPEKRKMMVNCPKSCGYFGKVMHVIHVCTFQLHFFIEVYYKA